MKSADSGGRAAPRKAADIVAALGEVFATNGPLADIRPIVMQVWAEAARDPEMAAIARDVLGRFVAQIAAMLPPGTSPEVSRLLTATVQGFIMQSLIFDDVTAQMVASAARASFR